MACLRKWATFSKDDYIYILGPEDRLVDPNGKEALASRRVLGAGCWGTQGSIRWIVSSGKDSSDSRQHQKEIQKAKMFCLTTKLVLFTTKLCSCFLLFLRIRKEMQVAHGRPDAVNPKCQVPFTPGEDLLRWRMSLGSLWAKTYMSKDL